MNHTRFLKEDHLPDCASRDNQVKKGEHIDILQIESAVCVHPYVYVSKTWVLLTF